MNMHQKALDTIDESLIGIDESEVNPRFYYVKGIALGVKGLGMLEESALAFSQCEKRLERLYAGRQSDLDSSPSAKERQAKHKG